MDSAVTKVLWAYSTTPALPDFIGGSPGCLWLEFTAKYRGRFT